MPRETGGCGVMLLHRVGVHPTGGRCKLMLLLLRMPLLVDLVWVGQRGRLMVVVLLLLGQGPCARLPSKVGPRDCGKSHLLLGMGLGHLG